MSSPEREAQNPFRSKQNQQVSSGVIELQEMEEHVLDLSNEDSSLVIDI